MNQSAFAAALGTRQNNVSRWESGQNRPTPDLFARMAGLARDVDKFFFLEEAGLPKEFFLGGNEEKMPSSVIKAVEDVAYAALGGSAPTPRKDRRVGFIDIPFLVDAVAAGSPLSINEKDISRVVPLPADWFPRSGQIFGLPVEGQSMEPILRSGDVVLVDTLSRDPVKLDGKMVAVRVGDGCTVKWLRRSGKHWQLLPQNTSPRHEIKVLGEEDDWAIVGEVVRWIGVAPDLRR